LLLPRPPGSPAEVIIASLHRDITVIGGSAGAIAALRSLISQLPADYPAAVFVVVHVAPQAPAMLHNLFARSALSVMPAEDRMKIRRGRIVFAPPDHHLVLSGDQVLLSHGPRENRHRPSIDVLFRSAAIAFGNRVTGVILSGMLDDGAAGMWAIRQRGGAAVVQHPDDAEFGDMPRSALERVPDARRVSLRDLPSTLLELSREVVESPPGVVLPNLACEVDMAANNQSRIADLDAIGDRAPYSCPECGGALWEVGDPGLRFRCHVGHAYSVRSLASEQSERVEAALWAALRGLEESERLARRLANDASGRGSAALADRHNEAASASASHAQVLRTLLAQNVRMDLLQPSSLAGAPSG
jgi:two-component system chemotaxis response regulator CheB